ncbi:ACT domain-containing protein [Marinicella litoralis]|uniref:Uncharacterized protein n=1 Tax=Marinicella litoralis TaxID=644220 RepID=A0A4R6XQT4_9GAMM|nr:ACT domain-containing protein [Marinicella litoralis]TDR20590.1 hypothetical protein C8D91_1564 [Marinicella litoralis]
MTGERDLDKLVASMSPVLMNGEYVFCSFKEAQYGDHQTLEPMVSIQESEGLTLVVPKNKADENNLHYESVFKGITLRVHSSLDAVGLTAAFAKKLTDHGISANVVAGYYHDHLFVPIDFADKAIEALKELAGL